jgi:hypothetical protein
MEWFPWSEHDGDEEELASITLSSTRKTSADIAYRASRNIQYGEELTIDYGSKWASALEIFKRTQQHSLDNESFRHSIQAPKMLTSIMVDLS